MFSRSFSISGETCQHTHIQMFLNPDFADQIIVTMCCFRWASSTILPKHLMNWRSWTQAPITGMAKEGHVSASFSSYWQTRSPSMFFSSFCSDFIIYSLAGVGVMSFKINTTRDAFSIQPCFLTYPVCSAGRRSRRF